MELKNNKVDIGTIRNVTEARIYLDYLNLKADQHYRDLAEVEDYASEIEKRHDTEGEIALSCWKLLLSSDEREHQDKSASDQSRVRAVKERFSL